MGKTPDTPGATLVATARIDSADHCAETMTCGCQRCMTERGARVRQGCGQDAAADHEDPVIAHMMRANRGTW
jgi:hypothetical protein